MLKTIHAIYEGGVFRPVEAVDLPDQTEVEFEPRISPPAPRTGMSPGLTRVYEIMSERYDSGRTDLAERHNEHQP